MTSAIAEALDREERMELVAQQIETTSRLLVDLERRRLDTPFAPEDRAAHEAKVSRTKTQLTTLEDEMAELVAAYDEQLAALHHAQREERERRVSDAEEEFPSVELAQAQAFAAVEDATAALADALAIAIDADRDMCRVKDAMRRSDKQVSTRSLMKMVAAHIYVTIRHAGLEMEDTYIGSWGRFPLPIADRSKLEPPAKSTPSRK